MKSFLTLVFAKMVKLLIPMREVDLKFLCLFLFMCHVFNINFRDDPFFVCHGTVVFFLLQMYNGSTMVGG